MLAKSLSLIFVTMSWTGTSFSQGAGCDEGVIRMPDRSGTIQICSSLAAKVPQLSKQLSDVSKSLGTQQQQLTELTRLVKGLNGIVMGRVDLTGSLGLDRDLDINGERIFSMTQELFIKSRKIGLENAVGGGVSIYSIPFFQSLANNNLIDRYETRKVIFKCPEALDANAKKGIFKAVGFELLWLKNKRDYYKAISLEDEGRLQMLEKRYEILIKESGGIVG